jgi:predicted enzyme related to lactoylglutathione lyase
MNMQRINFNGDLTVSLGVTDLQKSLTWYESVLGFKKVFEVEDVGWVELSSPTKNVTIGFSQVEVVEPNGSGATAVFGVANINEAKKSLEESDVRFDGDIMEIEGMVKLCTFFDPDGNTFMLSESLVS